MMARDFEIDGGSVELSSAKVEIAEEEAGQEKRR